MLDLRLGSIETDYTNIYTIHSLLWDYSSIDYCTTLSKHKLQIQVTLIPVNPIIYKYKKKSIYFLYICRESN